MELLDDRHPDLFSTTVTMIRYSGDTYDHSTGFFFKYNGRNFLVTNRHALNITSANGEKLKEVRIFTRNPKKSGELEYHDLQLVRDGELTWSTSEEHDIAVVPLDPPITDVPVNLSSLSNGSEESIVGSHAFTEDNLPKEKYLIGSGTGIVITGYPTRGKSPYYPYMRGGIVSSPFEVNRGSTPYFTTDAHMHTGTSGSPIMLTPNGLNRTKTGFEMTGQDGPFLIGVHSAEWISSTNDQISLDLNQAWYIEDVIDIIQDSDQGL